MQTNKKCNDIKTVVAILLLIIWATVIFLFSAKPAMASKEQSGGIVKIIKTVAIYFKANINNNAHFWDTVEVIIRKTAHFTVYFVLGFLSINCFRNFFKRNKTICISFLFSFLYAVSDEIHQYFVPGRACRVYDIIIDTCGCILGILLYRLIFLRSKRKDGSI